MTNITLPYKFIPRWYQIPAFNCLNNGFKRGVFIWHRRSGKDKTLINIAATQMQLRVGTYFYIFPTYAQGKKVIWNGMDRDGFKFLNHIPTELVKRHNSQEMLLEMHNGSVFQVIGSDNIDSIMGANPIGCIYSEYALQNPLAWEFVRPILKENGGWALFNYCVKAGTVVLGERGFREIQRESNPGFTDIKERYYGLDGFNDAESFYNGGEKVLKKITTSKGYEISCTPNHRLWTGSGWKRSDEYAVGDKIAIQRDQRIFGDGPDISGWKSPNKRYSKNNFRDDFKITNDFAYLMGLYLAEGNKSRGTVTISNTDPEIIEFLKKQGFYSVGNCHYQRHSIDLSSFLTWFGIKDGAKNKDIPKKAFSFTKEQMSSFLSGYFDGDGCALKRGSVKVTSVSKRLIDQLQVLLLNYGIISFKFKHDVSPTKLVKVHSTSWNLDINGYSAHIFFRDIGFRITRKQERRKALSERTIQYWNDGVELDREFLDQYIKGLNETDLKRHNVVTYATIRRILKKKPDKTLQKILDDNFYYDKILKVENDFGHVYDFVIPETKSFFSNGFVSHNTPRGANHGLDLYTMAKNNPRWFSQILDITKTGIFTEEDMDEEREEGMEEELIQQEYYVSFEAAVPGAYYSKHLRQARAENRLGIVPHDPSLPVQIAWDIGVGDSTAIWFFQELGNQINFIDYHEESGEGLPHYVQLLIDRSQELGYNYGTFFAPHDFFARDFGTGLSPAEIAKKDHGITVTEVPNIKVQQGIDVARKLFPRCRFDEIKCKQGIAGLMNYHKKWDLKNRVYRLTPNHDWSSHCADSFRYAAVGIGNQQGLLNSIDLSKCAA